MKQSKKMDRCLVMVGGGGHCKSVLDAVRQLDDCLEIVITDVRYPKETTIMGYPIVGADDVLPALHQRGVRQAFVTIGSIHDTSARHRVYENVKKIGFELPEIVDPSSIIAKSVKVGNGVFVGKRAVINSDSIIGEMAIINTGAIIEHECRIGKFTHVAVAATVCGGVEIADDVFIGTNATIIQGVKIGRKSVIGAGSIVLSNVPENSVVKGIWNEKRIR